MAEGLAWMTGIVLFALSGVHVYWAAGGRKGFRIAVPTRGEEPLFRPSKAATAFVAALLAMAGVFVLQLGGIGEPLLPGWLFALGGWALAAVFVLRAIGDFRWVGLFKSRKGTLFAYWDSVCYSPLCLLLGISLICIRSAA